MEDKLIKKYPWYEEVLKMPELQDIVLKNLYNYYLINNNINIILPIITSNSEISIRVIDWFVTNYSKKHNIIYEINNISNNNKYFNIYLQYKCQLKSYKKKLFDPFCRKNKIPFYYDENKCIITTIGQLNFFRWAIEYKIIDYIKKNFKSITQDMINSNKIVKDINNITPIEKPFNFYNNDSIIIKNPEKFSTMEISTSTDSDKNISSPYLKKRHQLSNCAIKSINIHNYKITLLFE